MDENRIDPVSKFEKAKSGSNWLGSFLKLYQNDFSHFRSVSKRFGGHLKVDQSGFHEQNYVIWYARTQVISRAKPGVDQNSDTPIFTFEQLIFPCSCVIFQIFDPVQCNILLLYCWNFLCHFSNLSNFLEFLNISVRDAL